jgi:hypothetical protein
MFGDALSLDNAKVMVSNVAFGSALSVFTVPVAVTI